MRGQPAGGKFGQGRRPGAADRDIGRGQRQRHFRQKGPHHRRTMASRVSGLDLFQIGRSCQMYKLQSRHGLEQARQNANDQFIDLARPLASAHDQQHRRLRFQPQRRSRHCRRRSSAKIPPRTGMPVTSTRRARNRSPAAAK